MKKRKGFFRFDASSVVTGHTIKSLVTANALIDQGWGCHNV